MALVLEKRFPDILGDRLITAVELSDPEAAAAFGYSPALVRETIHEAADRVDQVPVSEVFDWKRLYPPRHPGGAVVAGLYALVGGRLLRRPRGWAEGNAAGRLLATSTRSPSIWTERNVLLRNTIWPRRSYLEILPFEGAVGLEGVHAPADPTELRIPQGTPAAGPARPGLEIHHRRQRLPRRLAAVDLEDLGDQPAFLGGVDCRNCRQGWEPRDATTGMTVDEVEMRSKQFPVATQGRASELPAKWTLASANDESGWRPLMWADLSSENLAGLDVPGIPGTWDPKALPAMVAAGAGCSAASR